MNDNNASAIFNFVDAIDEENPALRTVVLDHLGKCKPLLGISVVNDSTYQLYEPAAFDILLQANVPVSDEDGNWDDVSINIITVDGSNYESAEEVLDESIMHATVDFLNNPDITVRHYTMDGVTDTIRGNSLTDMYIRRKGLAELFAECEPNVRDGLVNWLDNETNSSKTDASKLKWHQATGIPSDMTISFDYTKFVQAETGDMLSRVNTKSILTWHEQEDGTSTVMYHTLNGMHAAVNQRVINYSVMEQVEVTPDITKVVIISAIDDNLSSITLHAPGALDGRFLPDFLYAAEHLTSADYMLTHLVDADMSEADWEGVIEGHDMVNTNANGWDVPESELTVDEVIDQLLMVKLGSIDPEYKADVTYFSNEDNDTHTIILPPHVDISSHPSIVFYVNIPEDDTDLDPTDEDYVDGEDNQDFVVPTDEAPPTPKPVSHPPVILTSDR